MDVVSTKMTDTIPTNVSISSDNKKARYKVDCYILHAVLLAFVLLLIIAITCDHYAKHKSKQKIIDALTIQKWKTMYLKKFLLKIVHVIISMP